MIKPIWVYVEFKVQASIGIRDFGLYAALFSLSFLFINLADMGVNVYVTRHITSNKSGSNHLFFANAFTFKILACIFYPIFISLIGFCIGYRGQELYFLFVLGLIQSILQFVAFIRANFQALHYFSIDSIASVADKVFLLIVVLILLATGITLILYVHVILLTAIVTAALLLIVLIRLQGWIKPMFDRLEMKQLIVRSFPFAIIGLLYAINQRIDMVMVERLGGVNGAEDAGLYAASYRWMDAIMMFLWTVLPIFFAKFSAQQFDIKAQQRLFDLGQIICFVPLLFVSTVIFFYGENFFWMFDTISEEELSRMTLLLKILFVSTVVQGMFAIYGTLLNSTGHEKKVSVMVLISLSVNVLLNFVFIPLYGPVAAAINSLLSSILISILYLIYFKKHAGISIPFKTIGRLIIIGILFSGIFYLLTLGPIHWLVNSLIAGLVLLLFVYVFLSDKIKSYLVS